MCEEREFDENEELEEAEIIELTDDEGNVIAAEVLDVVEYEEQLYMILYPVEDGEETGVIIMQIEEGEEEDTLISVDNTIVLDAVFEEFKSRNNDVFDFEEE